MSALSAFDHCEASLSSVMSPSWSTNTMFLGSLIRNDPLRLGRKHGRVVLAVELSVGKNDNGKRNFRVRGVRRGSGVPQGKNQKEHRWDHPRGLARRTLAAG